MFDNVAILDRDLVLNRVRDLVNMTLPRWQSSPFTEVEAALTFLYQLGEALPASHGNHFSGDPVMNDFLHSPIAFSILKLTAIIFFPPGQSIGIATHDGVPTILWCQQLPAPSSNSVFL